MREPVLKPDDVASATWMKIRQNLQARLADRRDRLEGNHDPVETARIRGEIAEIKRILNFESKAPE
jgi:hypothetical protein